MTEYLFDIGDRLWYFSGTGARIEGPVLARESYDHGNYYYIGLSNPWLTEILIREDKLKKVEGYGSN